MLKMCAMISQSQIRALDDMMGGTLQTSKDPFGVFHLLVNSAVLACILFALFLARNSTFKKLLSLGTATTCLDGRPRA